MKKRFSAYAALGMTVILILSGCGSQTTGENGQEQADGSLPAVQNVVTDKLYNNEVMELPEGVSARLVQFSGGNIYLGGASQDQESGLGLFEISILSPEGELLHSLTLILEEDLSGSRFCVRDDGSICVSAEAANTGGPGKLQALLLFDGKGELLTKTDLTVIPGLRDLQLGPYPVMADDQGRISLLADNAIYLFDEQGSYQDCIPLEDDTEGWMLTRGGDGSVYTAYASGNRQYLARVDYENKSVIPVGQGFPDGRNSGMEVYAAGETSFWCSTGTTLYKYDYASEERIRFFEWIGQGIKGDRVKGVTGSEEELKILVRNAGKNSQLYTLTPLSEEEMAYLAEHGPTVITLAGVEQSLIWNPADAVLAFNASQRQYKVEVISYFSGMDSFEYSSEEYITAKERLHREIVLDTAGIDMIYGVEDLSIDVETLLKQGAIEDLTPWLEGSTQLNREDLLEPILQAFTVDGILVGLPKYFELECLEGPAPVLGNRTGWTLDEMLDFAEEHPDENLMPWWCWRYLCYGEIFIKEQDSKKVFDEEQCKRFLEICSALQSPEREHNQTLMFWDKIINYFSIKQDLIQREDAMYIGFPTVDGKNGIRVATSTVDPFLCICSQSDCKEGAWAFLEFYLNYEDEWRSGIHNLFPLQKSLFDADVETWLDPDRTFSTGTLTSDGKTWEYTDEGSQREVDVFLELLDQGCTWFDPDADVIRQIISEEAEPYFRGDKDLDTVVDIIGNRWMLYQAEKG